MNASDALTGLGLALNLVFAVIFITIAVDTRDRVSVLEGARNRLTSIGYPTEGFVEITDSSIGANRIKLSVDQSGTGRPGLTLIGGLVIGGVDVGYTAAIGRTASLSFLGGEGGGYALVLRASNFTKTVVVELPDFGAAPPDISCVKYNNATNALFLAACT